MATLTCETCGSAEGAQERSLLNAVACDTCFKKAVKSYIQKMASPSNDPRTGSPGKCKGCDEPFAWHQTINGRWLMLQPGDYPLAKIPPGKRWRVAGDGTAVNLRDANPTEVCRISHFDICPAKPAPVKEGAFLLSLWEKNRERQSLDVDE